MDKLFFVYCLVDNWSSQESNTKVFMNYAMKLDLFIKNLNSKTLNVKIMTTPESTNSSFEGTKILRQGHSWHGGCFWTKRTRVQMLSFTIFIKHLCTTNCIEMINFKRVQKRHMKNIKYFMIFWIDFVAF